MKFIQEKSEFQEQYNKNMPRMKSYIEQQILQSLSTINLILNLMQTIFI